MKNLIKFMLMNLKKLTTITQIQIYSKAIWTIQTVFPITKDFLITKIIKMIKRKMKYFYQVNSWIDFIHSKIMIVSILVKIYIRFQQNQIIHKLMTKLKTKKMIHKKRRSLIEDHSPHQIWAKKICNIMIFKKKRIIQWI